MIKSYTPEWYKRRAQLVESLGISNLEAAGMLRRINNVEARVAMLKDKKCGVLCKQTCLPCQAPAMKNGRCRIHGGLCKGPTTPEGKAKCRSTLKQYAHLKDTGQKLS